MTIVQSLTILLIFSISFINAERILVLFYHPGPSHFYSFYPLFNGLAERGHNVTVLAYNHVKNHHQNYNELRLDGIPLINSSIKYDEMWPLDRSFITMHLEFIELYNLAEMEREAAFDSPHIDRILNEHNANPFDLVLVELFLSDCMMGLIHKLNVPFIGFSTCALPSFFYDRIGLPDFPSYVPFAFSGFSWNMNWYERTINWLTVKLQKVLFRLIQIRDNDLIRKRLGNDIPDVAEIANNMSLIFVNQHYSYTGVKPLSNQLVEVSGIHLRPPKEIPQNIKKVLDEATDGIVLVSWGSNINSASIPEDIKKEILSGFAKVPQQIIWKWEDESINEIAPKNVLAMKWLPQQDILCHPNVKLFWSHGGNLGTIETVHCGKPAIITPFYGDQYLNAAALEERGMGFTLPLLEITADNIQKIFEKALEKRVYERAQEVSFEHRNRLNSPVDVAIWWVEHVIATSGFQLGRSNTQKLNWFTYHSFDAIFIILIVGWTVIFFTKHLISICWTLVKGKRFDHHRKIE